MQLPFEITLDTWIVSDTHFGHDAIARMCRRPDDHDWLMRTNWLEAVGRRDTVLHLGDLAYKSSTEYLKQVMRGLSGDKYLLRGNHDKKSDAFYESFGFRVLENVLLERFETPDSRWINHTGFYWHAPDNRRVLFSHYPDQRNLDWSVNVCGHIHNNGFPPGCSVERDYRNVSVEVVGYKPLRLRDILDGIDGIDYQSRVLAGVNDFEARRQADRRQQPRGPKPQQLRHGPRPRR